MSLVAATTNQIPAADKQHEHCDTDCTGDTLLYGIGMMPRDHDHERQFEHCSKIATPDCARPIGKLRRGIPVPVKRPHPAAAAEAIPHCTTLDEAQFLQDAVEVIGAGVGHAC